MLIAIAQAAEAATQPQGIAALGIDIWSIVFQLANFAILFWVLQRFAFKPLLKVLKDRQEKITESLHAASLASQEKAKAQERQKELLAEARKDAQRIVQQANEHSSAIIVDAQLKAEMDAQKIKAAAQESIQRDVVAAQAGLKKEATNLVIQATSHVIGETLDSKKDEALIKKALEQALQL